MKKTIEHTDDGYVVHTVNGVDTRTSAFYVRQVPAFEPLANGFDIDLAKHVLMQIDKTSTLWHQASWRTLVTPDPDFEPQQYEELVTALQEPEPKCGTAMCFAGWVGELSAANWVVDASLLKAAHRTSESTGFARPNLLTASEQDEFVLVTVEEAEQWRTQFCDQALQNDVGGLNSDTVGTWVYEQLEARGFTSDTHRIMHVSDYACVQLGLKHGDIYQLFHPANGRADLERILKAYAEHGVEPTQEGWLASVPPTERPGVENRIVALGSFDEAFVARTGVHRYGCSLDAPEDEA